VSSLTNICGLLSCLSHVPRVLLPPVIVPSRSIQVAAVHVVCGTRHGGMAAWGRMSNQCRPQLVGLRQGAELRIPMSESELELELESESESRPRQDRFASHDWPELLPWQLLLLLPLLLQLQLPSIVATLLSVAFSSLCAKCLTPRCVSRTKCHKNCCCRCCNNLRSSAPRWAGQGRGQGTGTASQDGDLRPATSDKSATAATATAATPWPSCNCNKMKP